MIYDKLLIDIFFKDGIYRTWLLKKVIKNNNRYYNVIHYLENRFSDYRGDLKESLYRIKDGVEKRPVCVVCGKDVKFKVSQGNTCYSRVCSISCRNKDPKYQAKSMKTRIARYGEGNATNRMKAAETCMKIYGVPNWGQSQDRKERNIYNPLVDRTKILNEMIMSFKRPLIIHKHYDSIILNVVYDIEKGVIDYKKYSKLISPLNLSKYRNVIYYIWQRYDYFESLRVSLHRMARHIEETPTCKICGKPLNMNLSELSNSKIYGSYCSVSCEMQDYEVRNKIFESRRANMKKCQGRFLTRPEFEFYELLLNRFSDDDILIQQNTPEYPFHCDFIVETATGRKYIEIQYFRGHGPHPYDPNNKDDQAILKELIASDNDFDKIQINTWTVSDVNKRNFAKKNGLTLIEVYPCDDMHKIVEKL